MTPHLAGVALQFLRRVQLSGAEVPAFLAVADALEEIARRKPDEPKSEQAA